MIKATIQGIPDLKEALLSIPDKLRKRALRNALAAGARVVQKAARRSAPTLNMDNAFSLSMYRRGQRKPGTLSKAISVRTSKMATRRGDVGVFVNVRPAKGAKRGAKSAHDPFYWAFVEFGHKFVARFKGKYTDYKLYGRGRLTGISKRRRESTGRVLGRPFMQVGAQQLFAALDAFKAAIGPQIAKLNKPKAPAP